MACGQNKYHQKHYKRSKVEGGFNLFMIEYLRFSSRNIFFHIIMKKYEITSMGSICS